MNRRDLLKFGASALVSVPFMPKAFTPSKIWGVETPSKKRILDFTEEELVALRNTAKNNVWDFAKLIWDFAENEGDTLKEKYERLYVQTIVLSRRILHGGNFIITSNYISPLYMMGAGFDSGKAPIDKTFLNPPGDHDQPWIKYRGTICCRWRLYTTDLYKPHELVMGRTIDNGAVQLGSRNLGYLEARNMKIIGSKKL